MKYFRWSIVGVLIVLTIPCSAQLLGRGGKTNAKARSGVIRMKQFNDTLGTYFWSHFDATKRSSLNFIDRKGNVRVLAEVQPDAALERVTDLVASAEWEGVSAETKVTVATTMAELGQRTAPVNMLRDGLYRIAELRYNDPEGYSPEVVERMMIALFAMVQAIAIDKVPAPVNETTTTPSTDAVVVKETKIGESTIPPSTPKN